MLRKIITIDKEACNGCGICVDACHEGAITLVDGKAELLRDDYCDGLGDCLPTCPTGAITFEEREALPYDEAAVMANLAEKQASEVKEDTLPCGCPSSHAQTFERDSSATCSAHTEEVESQLAQWPVQIKLVPTNAPYFDKADLLVAADCTAFANAHFHDSFMRGKVTIIGCPKLDEGDYTQKLTEILKNNAINSVTVARMEVPCCGGLERAAQLAVEQSGKQIPLNVVTIATDGRVIGLQD